MFSLKYIDDPNYRAVYIRQNSKQFTQSGGLWDTAHDMFADFGAKFNETTLTMRFPSGAIIQHKTCNHDRDLKNFDGK